MLSSRLENLIERFVYAYEKKAKVAVERWDADKLFIEEQRAALADNDVAIDELKSLVRDLENRLIKAEERIRLKV